MISIPMLKLRGDSICKPLSFIFKTCLRNGRFPLGWKNVVPILKKVINKLSKSIALFRFYQFVGKYLNASIMTLCLMLFLRITYFLQINLDLDQEILA